MKQSLLHCFSVFLLSASVFLFAIILYPDDFSHHLHVQQFHSFTPPPPSTTNVPSLNQIIETKPSSISIHNQTEPTLTQQAGLNDSLTSIPLKLSHHMSDQELIQRASRVSINQKDPLGQSPKVAFMFLTRGPLPLAPLWQRFFKGIDQSLYSIYVHSHPSFNQTLPRESVFYGRSIPSKVSSSSHESSSLTFD